MQTPDFYAGQFDSIERNVVLEPAWVRESIVVAATGTPTPQPQTSAEPRAWPARSGSAHRPGSVAASHARRLVVQSGQRGAQISLFVRGGDSDDNKILLDGVDVGDLGNQFDFGPLSTTAIESAEVYRGPDSNLYGAGAETGVVSLTTPHGTTSFPSLLFQGEAGNFNTSREELQVAGAHKKFDYLGAFSWLQTGNALPKDEYHVATSRPILAGSLTAKHRSAERCTMAWLHRRAQCLGFLSRHRQRHAEGPGPIYLSASSTIRPRPAFTMPYVMG